MSTHVHKSILWTVAALFRTPAPDPEDTASTNVWSEFQPDAMWLSLCVWDFSEKTMRPVSDVLVPGQKKVRLVVEANQSNMPIQPVCSKDSLFLSLFFFVGR